MEYFQPSHFSVASLKDQLLCINESNKLVASNSLSSLLIFSEAPKLHEYIILKDNEIINYAELMAIDNAISVVSMHVGYIILLSSGKLVYITTKRYSNDVKLTNDKIKDLNVEYLGTKSARAFEFLFYCKDAVCIVNISKSTIEEYNNVKGYIYRYMTLVTLDFDDCINIINRSDTTKKFNKLECMQGAKIVTKKISNFKDLRVDDIFQITIQEGTGSIHILLKDGSVVCYVKSNHSSKFYDIILADMPIKHIQTFDDVLFCLTNSNNLHALSEDAISKVQLNSKPNSANSFLVDYQHLGYYNMHSKLILYKMKNIDNGYQIYQTELNKFENYQILSEISKILYSIIVDGLEYIICTTITNTLIGFNISNSQFLNLNIILDISNLRSEGITQDITGGEIEGGIEGITGGEIEGKIEHMTELFLSSNRNACYI